MSKIKKSKNNLLYTIIVNHSVKIIQEIINKSEWNETNNTIIHFIRSQIQW